MYDYNTNELGPVLRSDFKPIQWIVIFSPPKKSNNLNFNVGYCYRRNCEFTYIIHHAFYLNGPNCNELK